MADDAAGGAGDVAEAQEADLQRGIGYLIKRIQSASLAVVLLAASIVVPLVVDHSSNKNRGQAMNWPTELCTYSTFLSGISLYGLVADFFLLHPNHLGPQRYVAIKALVHACALLLVTLFFALSLTMRINVVATSSTLAAAAALVAHRLWRRWTTALKEDVEEYSGREEDIRRLLELSAGVTAMLFAGWFSMVQNYPEAAEVAGGARARLLLTPEYLTFLTFVASSLVLLKNVPGSLLVPCEDPLRELVALTWALAAGVVATALAAAASKLGGYAALALLPVAVAVARSCAEVVGWPEWLRGCGHGGVPVRAEGEPPASLISFVNVSASLLLAVLIWQANNKEVRALSTMFVEALFLLGSAAVVAAVGSTLLTQTPLPAATAEVVQPAAMILSSSSYWLMVLVLLVALLGIIIFGW
ncbi:hypothetical protein ACP4OV_013847 [Aristida adscensionis]